MTVEQKRSVKKELVFAKVICEEIKFAEHKEQDITKSCGRTISKKIQIAKKARRGNKYE